MKEKSLVKGDAISIAEVAGIMGAKQTPNLVNLKITLIIIDPIMSLNSIGLCKSEVQVFWWGKRIVDRGWDISDW